MEQHAPYEPQVQTTLYLYDQAKPEITLVEAAGDNKPHASIRIGGSGFALAAWTPTTLRRFADFCTDAAYLLDQEIARAAAERDRPRVGVGHVLAEQHDPTDCASCSDAA